MNIRLFSRKDSKHVQSVARESWHFAYEGMIPHHIQIDFLLSAYSEQTLLKRQATSIILVAVAEEQIIGFIHFSLMNVKKEIELGALYILPAFHRQGVGTELLTAMHGYYDKLEKIKVSVVKQNEAAISFYHNKGFTHVGEMSDTVNGYRLSTILMEWRSNGCPNI